MIRRSLVLCGLTAAALAASACTQSAPTDQQKAAGTTPAPAAPTPIPPGPKLFVTNEAGGDLTVIDIGTARAVATIPLGKRPRVAARQKQ